MGKTNRRASNCGQSSRDVLRVVKKSCEKAKTKKTGGGKLEDTIARTSSLPIARTSSANSQTSSSTTNTDNDESGSLNEERLELNVTAHDTSILGRTTPRRENFVKDSSIKGIKSRLGWTHKDSTTEVRHTTLIDMGEGSGKTS